MGLISKIYTTINNNILFDDEKKRPSVKSQERYLHSFSEPKDVFEMSFWKYKCLQFYYYTKLQRFLFNSLSLISFVFLFGFFRLRGIRHDKELKNFKSKNILLRSSGKRISLKDIFPKPLEDIYSDIVEYDIISNSRLFLTGDANKLLRKVIWSHPFCFHYQIVVLMRLSKACYFLSNYSPACVSTYVCEREFADPIITEYYESHGVQYHAFMHGDYLYTIAHAFMHYSKYWVWSEHYRLMFSDLRCKFETEIYLPLKYSGVVKPRNKIEDYDFYATYYFSGETLESIKRVKQALDVLISRGLKCKIRPHPRFSNIEVLNDVFSSDYIIEDPLSVSIEQSIECSYISIAICSTVLSQAYYSNKKIVIDDVSDPLYFSELRERRYILIDKSDMLLSELIDGRNI